MGSKGTNTTTQNQTYTPNPAIQGAGYQALGMAGNAANQPFQNPVAPVAGFSGQQQQAFDQIGGMQGMAQPYFDQASALARQSAQPISADQIAHYYNPMAANVFAAQNDLFGQQRTQNTGNLVQAAGGVGADRVAVGQSELARQQGLAQGQTAAGLYQSALGAAEQDPARQAQAAFALGSFGPAAQNANLQGSQALLGAGGLQQQLAQAQMNAPYQNMLQRLAYPFQTSQFLAGIAGGLAPALGGTTNAQTTGPAPSLLSQILGGGLGAAGLIGGFGGFNSSPQSGQAGGGGGGPQMVQSAGTDTMDSAKGFAARGGAISPFATGGAPFGDDPFKDEGGTSVVPDIALTPGTGERPLLKPPQSASGSNNSGPGVMDMAKMAMMFMQDGGAVEDDVVSARDVSHEYAHAPDKYAAWRESNNIEDRRGETFDTMAPFTPAREPARPKLRRHVATGLAAEAGANDIWRRHAAGGAVSPFAAGEGYLEGGDVIDLPADDVPQDVKPGAMGAWRSGVDDDTAGGTSAQPTNVTALNYGEDGAAASPFKVRPGAPASPYGGGEDAMADSGPGAISNGAGAGRGRGEDFARSPWMALAAAGLGMMGGTSPFAGVNIGQGGLAGLKALEAQRTASRQDRSVDLHAQQLAEQAAQHQRELALKNNQFNRQMGQLQLEGLKPFKIGMDRYGREIYGVRDAKSGKIIPINEDGSVSSPSSQPPAAPPAGTSAPAPTEPPGTTTATATPPATPASAASGDDVGLPDTGRFKVDTAPDGVRPEVLEGMNAKDARFVKAISEGREKFLPLTRKNPYNQYIMEKVHEYDKNADETLFGRRQRTQNFFAVGTAGGGGQNIAAMNTFGQHAERLAELAREGNQGRFTDLNKLRNWLAQKGYVGGAKVQDWNGAWDIVSKAMSDEGAKIFAGTNSALADRAAWNDKFDRNKSMSTTLRQLGEVTHLIDGRLNSLSHQYNEGNRTNHAPREFLAPKTREVFDKLKGQEAPASPEHARALDEARAAIAAGRDRSGVIKKLESMGIKPTGL